MAKTFLGTDHFEKAKTGELFLTEWCNKVVHVKYVGRNDDNHLEFECVECDGKMSVIFENAEQAAKCLFLDC